MSNNISKKEEGKEEVYENQLIPAAMASFLGLIKGHPDENGTYSYHKEVTTLGLFDFCDIIVLRNNLVAIKGGHHTTGYSQDIIDMLFVPDLDFLLLVLSRLPSLSNVLPNMVDILKINANLIKEDK